MLILNRAVTPHKLSLSTSIKTTRVLERRFRAALDAGTKRVATSGKWEPRNYQLKPSQKAVLTHVGRFLIAQWADPSTKNLEQLAMPA